jgi:hypothetical protein
MEDLLTFLIVGAAVFYVVRSFYRSFKKGGNCACGCSSCGSKAACEKLLEKNKA